MLLTKDRAADLHLPDVDIKLPDIDLSDLKLSDMKMPDIDMPKVDFGQAKSDIGQAISSAVKGTALDRRSSPTRWPLAVVGLVAAGIATWAILTNEALRNAIVDAGTSVRRWFDDMWSNTRSEPMDPVAFDAAPTAPIHTDIPTADPLYAGMTDYPEGLGSKEPTRNNGEAVKVR
jgi:hypothetical protein